MNNNKEIDEEEWDDDIDAERNKNKKWWELLKPSILKRLEEYRPDYKELKLPDLDIRWRIDDWDMEEAEAAGKLKPEREYTDEEIDDIMRRQALYHKKYGNFRMPDDWNGGIKCKVRNLHFYKSLTLNCK